MDYTKYNQSVQRYYSNFVIFPGITKKSEKKDGKDKILKEYNVLWFLINLEE